MAFPSSTTYPGASTFPGTDAGAAPISVSPPTATAIAVAIAPLVLVPIMVAPPTAHATASTTAPTVQLGGLSVSPPTAHATAGATPPVVTKGAVQVSPPTARATAAGTAPSVTLSALIVSPPAATASAAAATPSVTVGAISVAPPTAHTAAAGIAPAVTIRTVPAAWTTDKSQRTILPFTSAVTSPTFVPPLQAAPVAIVERPLLRESVTVPDPATLPADAVRTDPTTGQIVIRDDVYDGFARTGSVMGVPHIIIDGVDRTYFREARTLVRSDDAVEPFGDQTLVAEFPQIDSLDDHDAPELAWLRPDASVHYVMQRWDADGPTGQITTLFHGFLVSDDTGNTQDAMQTVWTARGDLFGAAMSTWQPRVLTVAVDSGVQMAKALNSVTNRRFGTVPAVTTGIPTVQRGDSGGKIMAYVQRLLADATNDDGSQWTVGKKRGTVNAYEIRKKRTGRTWTVTNGQRGVEIDLSRDKTQSRNVIWGRGQRSDGGVWMRKLYPDGRDAPAYPFSSPGAVMSIGTTDASTSSGDGVSTWQRRAQSLGFHVTVDGVFGIADAYATRQLQEQYGIQVDGVVGPQTWNETFDVGALSADPNGWKRVPLAWMPGTQPLLYRANGTVIGPDPAYDETIVINDDDLDLGTDITLADGIRTAKQLLARENPIPLTGSVTLSGDPREGSRFDIEPGDELVILGYKGRNVTLYIPERGRDWQNPAMPVTLQVAEKAIDALTLAQIRQRNASTKAELSRAPGKPKQRPTIDPWDCESNAGHIERFALYGGLWTVIRFPMSEVGRISRMDAVTSVPAKFALTLFARPLTSAGHIRYFGANPSAVDNPGEAHRELLENQYGLIEAWGGSNGMLGFYPFTDDGTHSPTGRAKEAGVDYWSPDGYLYCGIWADRSCFIDLDFSAAPPEA